VVAGDDAVVADCNRVYVAHKATLSSPLTPVHYNGQPVECSWTIDGGTYSLASPQAAFTSPQMIA